MNEPVVFAGVHADADLLPVRMCNELVYCPRLFHLEHVQGLFVHSGDTVEGAAQHERARRRGTKRKVAPDEPPPEWLDQLPRRASLASERLGVRGEIDLLEVHDGSVVVVEAKRGRAPRTDSQHWQGHDLPWSAWPADVAQLALYIALLRDADIPCDEGRLYYRGSRRSVTIEWSGALDAFAHDVVTHARRVAALDVPPDPLLDSPKCPRCSLHEVCLPDEHHALRAEAQRALGMGKGMRKIVAGRDDRAVVHVLSPGTLVRKDGDALVLVPRGGEAQRVLTKDVGHVAMFGPVHMTQPCLSHLLRAGLPISHHTSAGRLLGITAPLATRNVMLRRAQYRAADDPARCLEIARALVVAKIRNQRTVVRRHRRGLELVPGGASEPDDPEPGDDATAPADASAIAGALRRMQHAIRGAQRCDDVGALLGFEGEAAAQYFSVLPQLLPAAWREDFRGRTRRPPRDRVNAMLSFGYAQLGRDATAALARVGLDPMLGLYHTMIPGRPALALDLIEPFRAAWVDVAVLRLLATAGIDRGAFHVSSAGIEMTDAGRRAMVRAYERRAAEVTTHPRFGYRMSYRRLLELEARILAKVLVGELDTYTPMWTR